MTSLEDALAEVINAVLVRRSVKKSLLFAAPEMQKHFNHELAVAETRIDEAIEVYTTVNARGY